MTSTCAALRRCVPGRRGRTSKWSRGPTKLSVGSVRSRGTAQTVWRAARRVIACAWRGRQPWPPSSGVPTCPRRLRFLLTSSSTLAEASLGGFVHVRASLPSGRISVRCTPRPRRVPRNWDCIGRTTADAVFLPRRLLLSAARPARRARCSAISDVHARRFSTCVRFCPCRPGIGR